MPAKFRMPIKQSPKDDPQQYTLYRLEEECLGGISRASLTLKQMQTFARAIARNYRVPTARFALKDISPWGGQCWTDGRIDINPKKRRSRGILTVAHEMAHHVHNNLSSRAQDQQAHGPEFLCCYMSLLDTCRILPLVASRALFKSYGLKFVDPGDDLSLSTLQKRISKG